MRLCEVLQHLFEDEVFVFLLESAFLHTISTVARSKLALFTNDRLAFGATLQFDRDPLAYGALDCLRGKLVGGVWLEVKLNV